MRWIQETEAKEQIAELLQEVERGESIVIVRDGKKVAHIVPAEDEDWDSEEARERRRQGVERFLEWKRTREPAYMSLEEILEARHEGHKY